MVVVTAPAPSPTQARETLRYPPTSCNGVWVQGFGAAAHNEDVDSNARLRALDEKISTWDLNNLNQLFDAFSKPRVIV